tara:strand:+ start:166 stop:348 length:183 start_codon:yes stop_codon:yes gene_type:complete
MPERNFGTFMKKILYPLGISEVVLRNGSSVYGFCCDASGVEDCKEITKLGGWRAYLEQDD